MQVILLCSSFFIIFGQPTAHLDPRNKQLTVDDYAPLRTSYCTMLHSVFTNENFSSSLDISEDYNCANLEVQQAEAISGGWCLASLVAAGYYRSGHVNPVLELIIQLSGNLGSAPMLQASNSGGSMFAIRYFVYRDTSTIDKFTFPCYLLNDAYREICYFHGKLGQISEECESETMNLVQVASGAVYGQLMSVNGGPMGVVGSYGSVYFGFLSDVPISNPNFLQFWAEHEHWNVYRQVSSVWLVAFTEVNSLESSGGVVRYSYGFDSFLVRGADASAETGLNLNQWYRNMTVYSVATFSANTMSGVNLLPFAFAGKSWSAQDESGASTPLKAFSLVLSYVMIQKLITQHSILISRLPALCEDGCPLLDGCFSDNGPVTPVLAAASTRSSDTWPRQLSLLGPASTMTHIKFLLGQGSLSVWTGGAVNLCPFTQVQICVMMTNIRELLIPVMPHAISGDYRAIGSNYQIWKVEAKAIRPFCSDPLLFDHFLNMCQGDSICHMWAVAVSGSSTGIKFSETELLFVLSMLWLAPSQIGSRFVENYIPTQMRRLKYYEHMESWFPDFVAIAPQKGGVGFTKNAGHSLLDYLTFLTMRLIVSEVDMRHVAVQMSRGETPACGYSVFEDVEAFNALHEGVAWRLPGQSVYEQH